MTTSHRASAEAVHLTTVGVQALPGLVEHAPVIDLGHYEHGRRMVGKLLEATTQADGSVTGAIALAVAQRDVNRPGARVMTTVRATFAVPAGQRVTAHLRTSVLTATPGAVDVEHGWDTPAA